MTWLLLHTISKRKENKLENGLLMSIRADIVNLPFWIATIIEE